MDDQDRRSEFAARRGLSRRDALRMGALSMGALALPNVFAACGSTTSDGANTASVAKETTALQPYDPNVAAGPATDLPKTFGFPGAFTDPGSLAFSDTIQASAEEAGLSYKTAAANGDLTKVISQTETMLGQGLCAIFMYPINEPPTRPLAQRALSEGVCVFGGAGRPYSTVQLGEDHAVIGHQQGRLAADWIRSRLGGRAKVVYFNEDSSPTIIPRHKAALAELKGVGPDVEIVSDIEVRFDPEAGAKAMSTILQAHPDVNVVLGPAGPLSGAYSVFASKGKAQDPDIFLASLAGTDADLAKIEAGDNIYRATFGYPFPVYGWGIGQFSADWQAGRSIPKLMTTPSGGVIEVSSPEAVKEFRADMKDPRATWENKRDAYVTLWGNISYETRDDYWRGEARLPRQAS